MSRFSCWFIQVNRLRSVKRLARRRHRGIALGLEAWLDLWETLQQLGGGLPVRGGSLGEAEVAVQE